MNDNNKTSLIIGIAVVVCVIIVVVRWLTQPPVDTTPDAATSITSGTNPGGKAASRGPVGPITTQ